MMHVPKSTVVRMGGAGMKASRSQAIWGKGGIWSREQTAEGHLSKETTELFSREEERTCSRLRLPVAIASERRKDNGNNVETFSTPKIKIS